MKRAITWGLGLGLCLSVTAATAQEKTSEELTDPTEILKKADEATKAATGVTYRATLEGLGSAQATVTKTEGTVMFSGAGTTFPRLLKVDAKFKSRRSPDPKDITLGTDGQQFYLIDHKTKMVHVGRNWSIWGGNATAAQGLLTREFGHETPFTDEINGEVKELRGSKMVGDEDCYEVYVKYAVATGSEAVWCFSKKDFLPRSRYDMTRTPQAGKEGGQIRTMTGLKVTSVVSEDAFKLVVPEGYTQTENPAP